jgi:4-phospho-D-threonate 3-dehydrogenase / 4-phospho-D-erythronate 3-dehydrogenase
VRLLRIRRLRVLQAVSEKSTSGLRAADKPRIAITAGDPAGIGPEIALRAAADPEVLMVCDPVIYGPSSPEDLSRFEPGRVNGDAGRAAYDAILRAVQDAQTKRVGAMATAPINKEAFALAGLPWKGHTDLLAHLTGVERAVMMFYSDVLRVVLATVHIPLADVPAAITRQSIEDLIRLTASELPRFGVAMPRLGMAGLNPHAGEHGLLGVEDERVLRPAVEACASGGVDVRGPFPADTIFVRAMRGEFDAVIACYHDQGLIPVKMAAFGKAVNVTLGLPIVRTSVDHGTAFDIARKGLADPSSMIEAVKLAARLATACQ